MPEGELLKEVLCARFPCLVDIVELDGQPAYMVLEDGKLAVLKRMEAPGEGKVYIPPGKEHLPFLLPSAARVQAHFGTDTDQALFNNLVTFFKGVSELPSEAYYYLLAWWAIHTYLYESFDYSPILSFYAIPERGKTRTGRGLAAVSYRGVETETLREANLFRWSQDLGATVFLDVKDLWRKAEKAQSEDILLKRYERGGKVARCLYPERGSFKDTVYYDIYGPTIISSNEAIHNILDTRCIPILMPESSKSFPHNVRAEDALPLKERLVAFRARHMAKPLPEYHKPAFNRLGDIFQPIGQVCALVSPKLDRDFRELVREILQLRLEDKAQSKEGRLIQVIESLEAEAIDKALLLQKITDAYNEGLGEKGKLSPDSVGRRLRPLGFPGCRVGKDRDRAIKVNPELLRQLKQKYGLASPEQDGEPAPPEKVSASGHVSAPDTGPKLGNGGHLVDTSPKNDKVSAKVSISEPDTKNARRTLADTSAGGTGAPPAYACHACGCSKWWWGPGGWTCVVCHPNPVALAPAGQVPAWANDPWDGFLQEAEVEQPG